MRESRARISVELRLGLQPAAETRVTGQEGLAEEEVDACGSGGALGAPGRLQPPFCCSQESSSSPRVVHPCYPRGYNETVSLSSFRTSPCTKGSDPRLTLSDRNVTLEGRGNASECRAAVRKLFNFSACGQSQDCTFDGIYQPPVRGRFIVRQIPASHLHGGACPWALWCPRAPWHCHLPTAKWGQKLPNYRCPGVLQDCCCLVFHQRSEWDHGDKPGAQSQAMF